jgi:nucleoside phosphorylase
MEGAAAAESCLSFDIPLVEIRAISNVAGEPDRKRWDIRGAVENLVKAVREITLTVLEV